MYVCTRLVFFSSDAHRDCGGGGGGVATNRLSDFLLPLSRSPHVYYDREAAATKNMTMTCYSIAF